ncbi:hypothetical protein Cgig2_006872 [Carnegiea gigantea]|uniref:PIN-like protein n=1 Tax=Carnegiea gigantea TaxID=171969 RepID=A0A9Q1Q607_9CARY|nr:hypothetical protein Cgig2_006872 [Carnegiea gigantea]
MGFWSLFLVASMPIVQVLIVTGLGAILATSYLNVLPADARRSLNKIVFVVFTPSLMFASLAKTVTVSEMISWWFMPINVGLTFFIGGALGWIVVKLLKPGVHLEGLVIATCSAANLGNLLIIVVPAICHQEGSPFGESVACANIGFSYSSFSMTLGGFFIWTYTYQLLKGSADKAKERDAAEKLAVKQPNTDLEASGNTHLLRGEIQEHRATNYAVRPRNEDQPFCKKVAEVLQQILHEVMQPPFIAAVSLSLWVILGLAFGAIPWLKHLIIGENAPFRVVQDCIKLLGYVLAWDGTIPCITLILGGNLTQAGLQSSKVKPRVIIGIICVKYLLLPVIGMGVVKAARFCGFLAPDPLYQFVLMLQFSLPPAMNIGQYLPLFFKFFFASQCGTS